MNLFNEGFRRDTEAAFRVAAMVRRSFALCVPFAPRSYVDESLQGIDALCTSEWDFLAQTMGRVIHSLVHSLPPDDAMRNLETGAELVPQLGADLVIPTTENLEFDVDYVPAARPAAQGAADLIRTASGVLDSGDVARRLALTALRLPDISGELPTEHGDRAPSPDLLRARQDAYLAAEDAYRWLMWRRASYLLGDDPEGVRVISTWAHIVDRALAGFGFDTGIIDRSRENLAIDRPF